MPHVWIIALLVSLTGAAYADSPAGGTIALIEIDGAIGPATSQYFEQASEAAVAKGAKLIILRLDTPGGLDEAMRDIIKRILASEIPVVTFVAPSGARAASAGTYILYASHVAAMAPATNLGAATPVPVMGSPPAAPPEPAPGKSGQKPQELPSVRPSGETMERKVVNDAAAYIRGLAEQRGRNADWAERAVREGVSLSAEDALKLNVIDLIAADVPELLQKLEGRKLRLAKGPLTLHTKGLTVERIEPTWRLKFLAVITNPAVAYILLLLGIYGLLLEGYSPGAILPGVVGGICLLLALYAFQILPVNYVGLALIALGIVMIVAEAFVPSMGVLGIGGVIAFVAGSILLMDTGVPGYGVPLGIVGAVAAAAAGVVLLTMGLLVRARRRPVVTGQEALLDAPAVAMEDFIEEGWVHLAGERWRARSGVPITRGQALRVVRVEGLILTVEPNRFQGGAS
ncbi:MAG: NfeD family protein [Nevskiales bacterium]